MLINVMTCILGIFILWVGIILIFYSLRSVTLILEYLTKEKMFKSLLLIIISIIYIIYFMHIYNYSGIYDFGFIKVVVPSDSILYNIAS